MNNTQPPTRRTLHALAALMAALFAALCLTACTGEKKAAAELVESNEQLVVIRATGTSGSMKDALDKLKEEGKLTFDGSESEYGFYITSVNGHAADASKNEFWAVYTTLGEYEGEIYSNAEYGAYDYNGTECASASYGVSGLPLVEGRLYILVFSSY